MKLYRVMSVCLIVGLLGFAGMVHALQMASGISVANSNQTINVPGDFDTIQKAIDAASEGDIIEVAAGTYVEILSIADKRIRLQGAGMDNTGTFPFSRFIKKLYI